MKNLNQIKNILKKISSALIILMVFSAMNCTEKIPDDIPEEQEIPDVVFEPEIILNEEFTNPGKPSAPDDNYWYYSNSIYPEQEGWNEFVPGDGFAYLKVDTVTANDLKASNPYQTFGYGVINYGHRLEVKMKGALVDGGLVGFIFTYNEIGNAFNEIDIELVADDYNLSQRHDIFSPSGWTDIRLNTWRNTDIVSYYPPGTVKSQRIIDALGDPVSHMDNEFHTYTIDWRLDRINYYIDDVLQETQITYVATGNSEVIIGFRDLKWAGDFNWDGIKTLVIDWFRIETLKSQPSAKFVSDKQEINSGESVKFFDQSPTATVWEWDFPGGTPSSSTEKSPQITYSNAGTYTATLRASNLHGTRETVKTNYIKVN